MTEVSSRARESLANLPRCWPVVDSDQHPGQDGKDRHRKRMHQCQLWIHSGGGLPNERPPTSVSALAARPGDALAASSPLEGGAICALSHTALNTKLHGNNSGHE